jgi:hypothetical protein
MNGWIRPRKKVEMAQKRKPLEFDDPYDEGVSSSGGSNWSAVQGNRPTMSGTISIKL